MNWKCPKCGRTFSRQDQPHYCGKPKTVEEYIETQDEAVRPRRNIIHFAAAKKHIGIYPGGEATTVFAEALTGMDVSKGTIRLPHDQELPAALIDKIARWCYKEYSK